MVSEVFFHNVLKLKRCTKANFLQKIVNSQAFSRAGDGKFSPDVHFDSKLCTHIIYEYAILDDQTLTMKPSNQEIDINNKMYEQVTALKKQGVKVMIALGGSMDSKGDKYGRLLTDETARKKFINHAVEFIRKHNFDGLDLVFEVS